MDLKHAAAGEAVWDHKKSGGIRSLFVTNDALSGHIGTAQILPYLEGLSEIGHKIECISAEPDLSNWDYKGDWKARLDQAGIGHRPLRRSSGKLYALERFLISTRIERALASAVKNSRPDLIHARSYMPMSAVMRTSSNYRIPFLFDMRGFWIDQRIEGGFWNLDKRFWRLVVQRLRAIESQAISDAKAIVTLTEDAREIVMRRPDYRGADIAVIPCAVREKMYAPFSSREKSRAELGIDDGTYVLAYLGSAGGLYRLDVIYRLWQEIRNCGRDCAILFIGDHELSQHHGMASKVGVFLDRSKMFFKKTSHDKVHEVLSAADIGISPIIQTFSSSGVSATKVGEYLACGLPVVSNEGVGDIRRIITDGENGFVLPDFTDYSVSHFARLIVEAQFASRQRISQASKAYFGLDRALAAYNQIYRSAVSRDGR